MLHLDEVSKSYPQGRESNVEAVRRLSLLVKSGEFIGIVGPSGAGKSTLLAIMGLLLRPDTGRVTFDGERTEALSDDELRRLRRSSIGFVFQYFQLLPTLTAMENVALTLLLNGQARTAAATKARELLANVGMLDRLNHFPRQLSGGELQRVAICRAMAHSPRLLLADEPTGNLDSKRGTEIVKLLSDARRNDNVAVVMVSHNREMLTHCDRVITLRDGRTDIEHCRSAPTLAP